MNALHARDDVTLDFLSVRIDGVRVTLVPIARDVAADILREFTAEVTRYMLPKPPDDIGQVREFIDVSRANMAAGDELVLSIRRRTTGEFLGVCGIHNRSQGDTPELGIWLKADAHGARLGREAIALLVAWAKTNLAFAYLTYPVDKANTASRRIAESLGGAVIRRARHESMSGYMLNEWVYRIDP